MKVLFLTNKMPYPPKDGGAIATLGMMQGFSNSGHDVSVCALNTKKHYTKLSEIPLSITNSITFYPTDVDTEINQFNALINLLFSKKPYNAVRFVSKQYKENLKNVLLKHKFDLIQIEGLYMMPYISLIRKYSNAIIAYRAHNIENEIWQRTANGEPNLIKKLYSKLLAKRIERMEFQYINQYDILVPITGRDSDILNKMGNNKPVFVAPAGININNYPSNADLKVELSIFHIGALDWQPNQEGLVWFIENCWPKIVSKIPNLRFNVAGRNAPPWIKELLEKHKINFLGEVDDAVVFMQNNAVMIVPLHSGSGMRIKIIEGMALGKAIISTSIGAEGIEVTHNQNIIIADTAETFTNAVIELLRDSCFANTLGKNAQDFISKNYNNDNITRALLDFYQNQTSNTKI